MDYYTYVDVNIDGLHGSHAVWSPIQTRIMIIHQNVINRFDLKEKKLRNFWLFANFNMQWVDFSFISN